MNYQGMTFHEIKVSKGEGFRQYAIEFLSLRFSRWWQFRLSQANFKLLLLYPPPPPLIPLLLKGVALLVNVIH